jgi:hypothetical protein
MNQPRLALIRRAILLLCRQVKGKHKTINGIEGSTFHPPTITHRQLLHLLFLLDWQYGVDEDGDTLLGVAWVFGQSGLECPVVEREISVWPANPCEALPPESEADNQPERLLSEVQETVRGMNHDITEAQLYAHCIRVVGMTKHRNPDFPLTNTRAPQAHKI